jgi:hypothetical protein
VRDVLRLTDASHRQHFDLLTEEVLFNTSWKSVPPGGIDHPGRNGSVKLTGSVYLCGVTVVILIR